MTSLFSSGSQIETKKNIQKTNNSIDTGVDTYIEPNTNVITTNTDDVTECAQSFKELGLCEWICHSTKAMGYKHPTPIQTQCIPAILNGRDVIGCAETGSGKTATFALPILQCLSEDPYGIYCLTLTPTRELAMQISEQFNAFGSQFNIRTCLIIGGGNILAQRLELSKLPHIVIATPGRLRHHIESASPPKLNKCKYLVLDEADRLLCSGFTSELNMIIACLPKDRQTLIFSATMTNTLDEIEKLSMKNALRFNLNLKQKLPTQIVQEYLFVPVQVKLTYLVCVLTYLLYPDKANDMLRSGSKKKQKLELKKQIKNNENDKKRKRNDINTNNGDNGDSGLSSVVQTIIDTDYPQMSMAMQSKHNTFLTTTNTTTATSGIKSNIIIFVNSCKKCEEVSQMLNELGFNSVCLHSIMSQDNRIASLHRFKSYTAKILVATDVASRGLDIPNVDLIINMDLPVVVSNYIHRIGRTGRAGKFGKSISLISPYEVDIIHEIEEYTTIQMVLSDLEVASDEKILIPYLNPVAKSMRTIQLKLLESGFDEKVQLHSQRKKEQNKTNKNKNNKLNEF